MSGHDRQGVGWFEAAGDLFLGGTCAACGAPVAGLCGPCRLLIEQLSPFPPARVLPGFPRTWSAGPYEGPLRGVLNAYKERGAWGFAGRLGGLAARAAAGVLLEFGGQGELGLVPMPSAARVVRERGLDVTRRIAASAAARLRGCGQPVRVLPVLAQRRGVRDQTELGADQRWANVARGMTLLMVPELPVLLLDDVVTTGATLTAAACLLRQRGVAVLGAATVAATLLRKQGRPADEGE